MRYTLCAPARAVQEIKKSKFAAFATNVASPEAAMSILAEMSDLGASHNCWAWRVGAHYRFGDDGEPAGTAGKPILQAIDGQELDRIVVVVTRWFGGIKLGAGGLMRAYGGCAAECLRNAVRQEIVETIDVEFAFAFSDLPLLIARLGEFDTRKITETFDANGVHLRLRITATKIEALRTLLGNLSRGRCEVRIVDP
jgi:uncharacterized YigZ family protein